MHCSVLPDSFLIQGLLPRRLISLAAATAAAKELLHPQPHCPVPSRPSRPKGGGGALEDVGGVQVP